MQDLSAQREKFLTDAADCELIGNLASDAAKRETFRHLAKQLRQMADDIAVEMVARERKGAA
jgi:hypothetical protein